VIQKQIYNLFFGLCFQLFFYGQICALEKKIASGERTSVLAKIYTRKSNQGVKPKPAAKPTVKPKPTFNYVTDAPHNASFFKKIHIVCTAALVDAHFEYRQQQYMKAFNALISFGYNDFFIIESIKKHGPTFLNDYSKNVFYATVNDATLYNHGINEAKTLLEGCAHFGFQPDDMIVKLTGRHALDSDAFLKTVEKNPGYDAFIKVDKAGNLLTVGFAMRYKYLKEMYETIDYSAINNPVIAIEIPAGNYVKNKRKQGNLKVYYLDHIGIVSDVYGSTTVPGIPHQQFSY
jgi:hypothetical protein